MTLSGAAEPTSSVLRVGIEESEVLVMFEGYGLVVTRDELRRHLDAPIGASEMPFEVTHRQRGMLQTFPDKQGGGLRWRTSPSYTWKMSEEDRSKLLGEL